MLNATARAMSAARTVALIKNGSRPRPGEISAVDAALMADCHRSLITDAVLVLRHGTPAEITRAQNGSGLSAACARIRANSRQNDGVPSVYAQYLIDVDPDTRRASAWVGSSRVFSMTALCHSVEQVAVRLLAEGFPDHPTLVRYGDILAADPKTLTHLARGRNWQVAA